MEVAKIEDEGGHTGVVVWEADTLVGATVVVFWPKTLNVAIVLSFIIISYK